MELFFIFYKYSLTFFHNHMNDTHEETHPDIDGATDTTAHGNETHVDDVTFEEVNEDGENNPQATIKKLREKVKKLEQEKNDNLHGWTRAQADYVNFKKEVEERRKDDIKFATKRLLTDILPALDAYTLAQSNKESWEKVDANWRMGIEYIFGQLLSTLEKEGLTAYGEVGQPFDPNLHESIEVIPTSHKEEDNTLQVILQKGYLLNGQVLRVARVKTASYTETV
jgi:molecular chaperone GrpE